MSNMEFKANGTIFGGTEFMLSCFNNYVKDYALNLKKYNCILMPGDHGKPFSEYLNKKEKMIIWMHNLPEQLNDEVLQYFLNTDFVNQIKYVIVVSNFAKEKLLENTKLKENQIHVIYNVVFPIKNNIDRFKNVDKVKIIHTSSFDRGCEILIESLKYIDRDFELNIYNDINPDLGILSDNFNSLYKDDRLFFYWRTPKKTVIKDLSKSHIMAYPVIYEETFCLSLAESLSANCLSLYNDFGSLKEVSLGYGLPYSLNFDQNNIEEHSKFFAKKLTESIDLIKSNNFNPKEQSKKINKKFSIENFKKSWINLDKTL